MADKITQNYIKKLPKSVLFVCSCARMKRRNGLIDFCDILSICMIQCGNLEHVMYKSNFLLTKKNDCSKFEICRR